MSFHMSLVKIHLLDYKEKAYLCRALHTLHIHFFIKLEVFLWGAIFYAVFINKHIQIIPYTYHFD